MTIGFAGLGTMGSAIAANLLRAGTRLVVWNRSPERCAPLLAAGATRAESIDALCATCSTILVMLLDEAAIDAALGRGSRAFAERMRNRTVVHLGTTSPEYSQQLERDLLDCDARYVEAPVSGSRVPAERGELVGMLAGRDEAMIEAVRSLLAPACRKVFHCGAVPGASRMKLAVNHYLVVATTALAETVHAARRVGVDVALLRDILDAGPMASAVSRTKLDMLVREDFAPQAAIRDVATIAELVATQARRGGARAPLIDACADLYRSAFANGDGELDIIGVARAFDRSPIS